MSTEEAQVIACYETAKKVLLAADDDLIKFYEPLCQAAVEKGDKNELFLILQRMPESVARFHLWRKYAR